MAQQRAKHLTNPAEQLKGSFSSESEYLPILQTLAVFGVAENTQLQSVSGMGRDKLRRTLDKLQALGMIRALQQEIHRRLGRGRSPVVWRLEKNGADFLKTRPSELEDERAVTHALAMLDVYLQATREGLETLADQPIPFSGGSIRPDLRVRLPNGLSALFEIEQDASPALLRRIVSSLRHKQQFFTQQTDTQISPIIRLIVALPRGTIFDRTITVWSQALDVLRNELGSADVAFQLAAMPLPLFLDQPDWNEPPTHSQWLWITTEKGAVSAPGLQRFLPQIPQRSSLQDRLILAALLQALQRDPAIQRKARQYPQPNPQFFRSMEMIYAASHADGLQPLEQAAFPWASLFLLRHYLHLHPELRAQIEQRLQAGAVTMRWNTTTILHRMQSVIDLFLAYHGWRSDGPLSVFADVAPWEQETVRTFQVIAHIRHPELLIVPGDTVLPHSKEIRAAEQALAWVLTALFRYSTDLGFRSPPFW